MPTVFFGLGSNIGRREENLKRALTDLRPQVRWVHVSSLYETEPVGVKDQPWFLNAVARGETDLPPVDLLNLVKSIEKSVGRQQTVRYGPRRIDIDILFYEDRIIRQPGLIVPHPRLTERAFVLVPLAEIAPHLVHPELGLTVSEILHRAKELEEVKKLSRPTWPRIIPS